MEPKKSRAAAMAAQYADKLKAVGAIKPEPRQVKQSDKETPEMRARRRAAVEKLASFRERGL